MSQLPLSFIHGCDSLLIAVGENSKIYHLAAPKYLPMPMHHPAQGRLSHLRSVHVLSPTCAWAAGEEGALLRWDGIRWLPVALSRSPFDLRAVWCFSQTDVRIGGTKGLLRYRGPSEGGDPLLPLGRVLSLWGCDNFGPATLFCLLETNQVIRFTGDRMSLLPEPPATQNMLLCLSGTSPTHLFAAGHGGTLCRFDGRSWSAIDLIQAGQTKHPGAPVLHLGESILALGCVPHPCADDLWLATSAGRLLRYQDGVLTHVATWPAGPLTSLHVDFELSTVFATAHGGILRHR